MNLAISVRRKLLPSDIMAESLEYKSEYMDFVFEDGVLCATYKELAEIDLEAARISVEDRKRASGHKAVPILIDARRLKVLEKPARDYFASEEGSELLTAAAILVDSVFTTYLGNFVMKISFKKQKIPLQLFNDRNRAIEWLQGFVVK